MRSSGLQARLKNQRPGYYAVGNGLYFRISKERTGFWVLRYSIRGKRREISLGSYPEMSLADANTEAALQKNNIKNRIDPLAERKRAQSVTFNPVNDSIFLPLFPFMRNSPSYFRAPVQERYGGFSHLDLQVLDFHLFAADNQPPRDQPVNAGVNIA